jgi:hypothetical protein
MIYRASGSANEERLTINPEFLACRESATYSAYEAYGAFLAREFSALYLGPYISGRAMTMASRFLTSIAVTVLAILATGAMPVSAAAASTSGAAAVDPGPVSITGPDAAHAYRFDLLLPAGANVRALSRDGATTGEILVEDSAGKPVGAYDAPWASDARGRSLATSYRIAGQALIQTVAFDRRTRFPVTIDPVYSTIGVHPTIGLSTAMFASAGRPSEVTVPANYVYNPALGSFHDYCTLAPDEFPAPGAPNADFRGPCARHDLCYEGATTSRFSCDNTLLGNMYRNCEHYYGVFSLLRAACKTTALVYWAAVVAT